LPTTISIHGMEITGRKCYSFYIPKEGTTAKATKTIVGKSPSLF